jgi:hypothetical protein
MNLSYRKFRDSDFDAVYEIFRMQTKHLHYHRTGRRGRSKVVDFPRGVSRPAVQADDDHRI